MQENEEMSPERKHFMQSSIMFGCLAIVLQEVAPERTREMLEAAQRHCLKNGYGDDIPGSVINTLYRDNS